MGEYGTVSFKFAIFVPQIFMAKPSNILSAL